MLLFGCCSYFYHPLISYTHTIYTRKVSPYQPLSTYGEGEKLITHTIKIPVNNVDIVFLTSQSVTDLKCLFNFLSYIYHNFYLLIIYIYIKVAMVIYCGYNLTKITVVIILIIKIVGAFTIFITI